MLILPFAYPKSLFDCLKQAALDLQADIAARMPAVLQADICELYFRTKIVIDLDPNGQLEELRMSLLGDRTRGSEPTLTVVGEISFEAPQDAVVLSAEILEEAWIDAAVHRRLAAGRELFTLPDAALDDIIAAPPPYQKEIFGIDGSARFLHRLALRERDLRLLPISRHEAIAAWASTQRLKALLEREVEAAVAWWRDREKTEGIRSQGLVLDGRRDKDDIVRAYRDHHYGRDGVWPLFNLWGEERYPETALRGALDLVLGDR